MYHDQLMSDGGLIIAEFIRDQEGVLRNSIVLRLTNAGHDFLENARNEGVWKDFKKSVAAVGGGISMPVAIRIVEILREAKARASIEEDCSFRAARCPSETFAMEPLSGSGEDSSSAFRRHEYQCVRGELESARAAS